MRVKQVPAPAFVQPSFRGAPQTPRRSRPSAPRATKTLNSLATFIGVLRDRLGELEDRFFATVFFGSGLLFLAMLFVSAALVKAIIIAYGVQTERLLDAVTFTIARSLSYEIMNIYAIKMAGVFMISLSTISVRTRITPRWIAILGYALALLILFGSRYISWTVLAFPLWVLLISVYILIDNWRPPRGAAAGFG